MYSTTITRSGQVTIPKELRAFLGVKPGQRITFTKNKDSITINRRLTDEEFTAGLDAISARYGNTTPKIDAVEAVRSLRDGKNPAINEYYRKKFGV